MTNRRDFLASSALAALAVTVGRSRSAWGSGILQPQAQPVFTLIRRNVGYFTMRGGTIGYLVSPRAVVVVDSQFPAEGKTCLDGLQSQSSNHGVDYLINTHHHGDHTGGNVSFKG